MTKPLVFFNSHNSFNGRYTLTPAPCGPDGGIRVQYQGRKRSTPVQWMPALADAALHLASMTKAPVGKLRVRKRPGRPFRLAWCNIFVRGRWGSSNWSSSSSPLPSKDELRKSITNAGIILSPFLFPLISSHFPRLPMLWRRTCRH